MAKCASCLEQFKPGGFLGFGGRPVAGACEVCGEKVCGDCLTSLVARRQEFHHYRGGGFRLSPRKEVDGSICRACLYEWQRGRGYEPRQERPARVAIDDAERCAHSAAKKWMSYCPDCGAETEWKAKKGQPTCDECGAPSHKLFNYCWSCRAELDGNDNDPRASAAGFALEFGCDNDDCEGNVALSMNYCPWCAESQDWDYSTKGAESRACGYCETDVAANWRYCAACGEKP